jgi:hypothetical protein
MVELWFRQFVDGGGARRAGADRVADILTPAARGLAGEAA